MKKKIVYVDMDNTIVDFKSGIEKLSKEDQEKFKDNFDDHPEIFASMEPIDGAIEALKELNNHFDLYILSTAPWDNPNAWKHKREWIEKYFGKGKENIFYKKVILSHHKNLNRGDILIDDRPNNGAKNFKGNWIQYGSEKFPDWETILQKLKPRFYKTKSVFFLLLISVLLVLGNSFYDFETYSSLVDEESNDILDIQKTDLIPDSSTTTTVFNQQLANENFESAYINNHFKETFYLNPGENSVSFMSDWLGESTYYRDGSQDLSEEDLLNINEISINGVICSKLIQVETEAYLDRYHPWSKDIKDIETYRCNDQEEALLYGSPFFADEKWWIFKDIDFNYKDVECDSPCQPEFNNFATLVQIDETSLLYNIYKPLSDEKWKLSKPWLQYLEYMWNIYWIFDLIDISETEYEVAYSELFLNPAFTIFNGEDYFNCYLYGGVGMTGPDWVDGFFPQPVETVVDQFNNFIVGGYDWSWGCFLDEREDEYEADIYINGSGPPIVYPHSLNNENIGNGWVMYGTKSRPNNLVYEKGVFYPITSFYWFNDGNTPSIDFVCNYLEENNIKQQNYFEPLYSDCTENS